MPPGVLPAPPGVLVPPVVPVEPDMPPGAVLVPGAVSVLLDPGVVLGLFSMVPLLLVGALP